MGYTIRIQPIANWAFTGLDSRLTAHDSSQLDLLKRHLEKLKPLSLG